MPKVRIQLQGGLGNQLFILAMAHEIEQKYSTVVEIVYVKDKLEREDRKAEIGPFLSQCEHRITLVESTSLGLFLRMVDKIKSVSPTFGEILEKLLRIYTCTSLYENSIFTQKPPRILRGFFQNIEIIEANQITLLKEIEKTLLKINNFNVRTYDQVLHIRRGDTKDISSLWGVLSVRYYLKKIEKGERILICTDETDVDFLKNTFTNCTIISAHESTPLETLATLANSRKLVMANSSLSWWAGWYKSKREPETIFFPVPWRPNDVELTSKLLFNPSTVSDAEFELQH